MGAEAPVGYMKIATSASATDVNAMYPNIRVSRKAMHLPTSLSTKLNMTVSVDCTETGLSRHGYVIEYPGT